MPKDGTETSQCKEINEITFTSPEETHEYSIFAGIFLFTESMPNELRREKTVFLPMRKQRRRSASQYSNCEADQRLCFRYTDSTISLLLKSELSSF